MSHILQMSLQLVTAETTCHVKRAEQALGGEIPQPNPVFSIFVAFKGIWFADQRTNARSEQVEEGEANPSQEVRCSSRVQRALLYSPLPSKKLRFTHTGF